MKISVFDPNSTKGREVRSAHDRMADRESISACAQTNRRETNGAHHRHAVVEQRLAEHHDEEDLVDVHLLEHGDDGHGVHGRDQTAEEEVLQQADVQVTCQDTGLD
ncbi:hypothetical protein EYF80_050986 [Liparis tanakae]|uniref:Uncharacterized protein n=1 Tax=Liparis tanakae TaxID=230148 RepID=A0A4Z2FDJ2_9TELE|nr:hypothetical protein EYF80_050986 [Liparis tanakae]